MSGHDKQSHGGCNHDHEAHGHNHETHGHNHDECNHAHDSHDHAHETHGHDHETHGHDHETHTHDHGECNHGQNSHNHDHGAHSHDHETHDHAHHGHSHDGHTHVHDIYTEDGIEPTVVSLTHEIPAGAFPAGELERRAQRIVFTLASVCIAKGILIGHIKLQLLENEDSGLFISATGPRNITVTASEGFPLGGADASGQYEFGLTVIVFGMSEGDAASLAEGIVDGILCCPV